MGENQRGTGGTVRVGRNGKAGGSNIVEAG